MSQIQIDILNKASETKQPDDVIAAARLVNSLAADASNDQMILITDMEPFIAYHEQQRNLRGFAPSAYDYSLVHPPKLEEGVLSFCSTQSVSGIPYAISVALSEAIDNLENTEFLQSLFKHVEIFTGDIDGRPTFVDDDVISQPTSKQIDEANDF